MPAIGGPHGLSVRRELSCIAEPWLLDENGGGGGACAVASSRDVARSVAGVKVTIGGISHVKRKDCAYTAY